MKNKQEISLFILSVLLILSIGMWHVYNTNYGYNYDDSKISLLLEISEEYGETTYKNNLNEIYDTYAFLPQGGSITQDKVIFPKGFLGEKINLVPLHIITGGDIEITIKLFQVFFFLLIFISGFLIIKLFSSERYAIIGSLIITISPVIVVLINIMYPQLQLLFYGLLSSYFVLKLIKTNDYRYAIISGILGGILLGGNFSYFLFILAIGIVLFINYRKELEQLIKYSLIILITSLIFFSPTLIFNEKIFANPFENFYTSYESPYAIIYGESAGYRDASLEKSLTTFYLANKDFFYNHFITAKMFVFSFLFLSPLMYLMFFSITKKSLKQKEILYLIIIIAIPWILFGGLNDYFGFNDPSNLRPSIWRYLILQVFLGSIIGFITMINVFKNKKVQTILVVFLVLQSFIVFTSDKYPFSIYVKQDERLTLQERWNSVNEIIISSTSKESIIFVEDYDYGFLGLNRETFNYEFIPSSLREEETFRVAEALIEDGKNVYVYRKTSSEFNFNNLFDITEYQEIPKNGGGYELFKLNKN